LDWDTNSPAIAGLLVVVSSTRQWLVKAAKDTETNCEAGDGSRGHCNVSGGVSCLYGWKTKNGNDKTAPFLAGAAISQFGPWSFQNCHSSPWSFNFKF
jgi:hypothetical protein